MLVNNLFSLHLQVSIQRQRLEDMAERYGLDDERVLVQSRKLDELVNELQRRRPD